MDQDGKAEVEAAYQAYLRSFLANDLDAIDALIRYPLAYIGNDEVKMLDSYPFKPAELMASKQWHSSVGAEVEVVEVSSTKAHVMLRRARRVRADGSLIETVSGFYAFTKTEEGWKIFAISDITLPA